MPFPVIIFHDAFLAHFLRPVSQIQGLSNYRGGEFPYVGISCFSWRKRQVLICALHTVFLITYGLAVRNKKTTFLHCCDCYNNQFVTSHISTFIYPNLEDFIYFYTNSLSFQWCDKRKAVRRYFKMGRLKCWQNKSKG